MLSMPWAWLIRQVVRKKGGFHGTLGTMAKSATAVSLHSLHLFGSFLLHFLSLFTTMFCDYFKVKKKLALRLKWQFLFRLL